MDCSSHRLGFGTSHFRDRYPYSSNYAVEEGLKLHTFPTSGEAKKVDVAAQLFGDMGINHYAAALRGSDSSQVWAYNFNLLAGLRG